MLGALEQGARLLRRAGLGGLVDRAGEHVGRFAAARVTEVGGVRLAGNHPGQLYYLRELAEGRDRFLVALLAELTPSDGVAVDGGAHIGYLTVHLARAVGPEGRVYAFEPEAGSRTALAGNLERNGVAARVTVFPRALGAGPGRATLHVGGGGETSTLAPLAGERATAEVEVAALDDVLPRGTRVDVVKLDLEGGETAALRGMRRTLERSEQPVLVVELNPGRLAALGSSQDELLALVAELGFTARVVDEERGALVGEIAVRGEYVNLLCRRP
jgi:FkbM family methyltransferase